jgi:hypothetical protein
MSTEGKVCSECAQTKELSAFYQTRGRPIAACKVCTKKRVATYQATHKASYCPAKQRSTLLRRYGLTPENYAEMHATQGGVCAMCRRENTGGKPLFVDHCHTTGQVRALLCHACNVMLGMADDCPDRLEAGAAYLKLHASAH